MSREGGNVRIAVEHADALSYSCDVLALKYAQQAFGADLAAIEALSKRDPHIPQDLPAVGEMRVFAGRPELGAKLILLIGVKPLYHFQYPDIRDFARTALEMLFRSDPNCGHAALTLHGPGYGLDEKECFDAEISGLLDALTVGAFPGSLQRITIVERNVRRSRRLQAQLEELLKSRTPEFSPRDGRGLAQGYASSERIRAAGYGAANKPLIFVAMPFREDMHDHFLYGIARTAQDLGFLCERADQAHFTGDILEWVKSRIAASRAVIADLSFANANVYLEVGYAWGCSKPTILIAREGEELKFDLRGQRCIHYKWISDLEEAVKKELLSLPAAAVP
jgi:hypothetical protein